MTAAMTVATTVAVTTAAASADPSMASVVVTTVGKEATANVNA